MPTKRYAPQVPELYEGDDRVVSVDCSGWLDDGELLSGTPVVDEPTLALETSAAQVSTTALTIDSSNVEAGAAVLFRVVRGDAADGVYEIDIIVTTTTPQTISGAVRVECK